MAKIKLKDIDTNPPKGTDKNDIKKKLSKILAELDELQNLLYAENRHSVLIVVQGMDAAGKDGLTRDVFTSMNPQGVNVKPFKEP
ncbi:MAG: polyphosphate kinase, partial [Flavipsychrobacter sp.]